MNQEKRTFSVDSNVIWDLIFRQHHSIDSALSELIQNAYDAGAGNLWLTITSHGFECIDDGNGFSCKSEVTEWFEVFGLPHDDESEIKFARFRMGRGQIMGLASTSWRSGEFLMEVDPKNKGLDYTLTTDLPFHGGCKIIGDWYKNIDLNRILFNKNTEYEELLDQLKRKVKYIFSMKVFVNGELVSISPDNIEWTIETEDFYFLRNEHLDIFNRKSVSIYNLGIYVDSITGLRNNGIVVTKKHLKLNITRSRIQAECPVFDAIKLNLRKRTYKFSRQKKYSRSDAYQILYSYCNHEYELNEIKYVKLIHDIHGRKVISLAELSEIPHTVPDFNQTEQADLIDQLGKYFVVNPECLPKMRNDQGMVVNDLFNRIEDSDVSFAELLSSQRISIVNILESIPFNKVILHDKKIKKNERLILDAINKIPLASRRRCLLGVSSNSKGWTDGHSYIAIDRNWLKKQGTGLRMAISISRLLIHEYSHVAGETDLHDGFFYKRFHDNTDNILFYFISEFLRSYDDVLAKNKVKTTDGMKRAIQAIRRGGKSKIN